MGRDDGLHASKNVAMAFPSSFSATHVKLSSTTSSELLDDAFPVLKKTKEVVLQSVLLSEEISYWDGAGLRRTPSRYHVIVGLGLASDWHSSVSSNSVQLETELLGTIITGATKERKW